MWRNLLVFFILYSGLVQAEIIEFPEEELATETVLPVFDRPTMVRNRNVQTTGRFEVGAFGGLDLVEAIYSQALYGASATYHLNEVHGVHVSAQVWVPGYTDNAKALREERSLFFEFTPAPESLFLASYQYTAWYGKLSISKKLVMNTALYSLLGAGGLGLGGKILPVVTGGLGQKFYFTKSTALRIDLRLVGYQGPNPLSVHLPDVEETLPVEAFQQHFILSSQLTVGFVFLL